MATNRELQAAKTRDKIYETALKLINEKGFENVSVEDITKAAGVAKGTFYHHFDSKENLLYYTYVYLNANYATVQMEAEKKKTFDEAFDYFFFESYRHFAALGRNVVKALCQNLFTEESRTALLNEDRELNTAIKYLINRGIEEKKIDSSLSMDDCVDVFLSMMIGLETFWSLSGREKELPAFAHRCAAFLLNGITKG